MKSVLISDDKSTIIGLRLAGITGMLVKDVDETKRAFQAAKQDDTVGIVILTENVFNVLGDLFMKYRSTGKLPLLVTIPGRNGLEDKDFIMKYVRESIGVKVDE